MIQTQELVPAIFAGWHNYQELIVEALRPLDAEQLNLRASPELRTIGDITAHIIGARARWFYQLMNEGGETFKTLGNWDRRSQPARSAEELIYGLETTWEEMQAAIERWTEAEWQQTYPGDEDEPEIITRQWVVWHLIEHDLHHGGEISLTLGMHGLKAPAL